MLLVVGQQLPGWKGPSKEGGEFNIDRGGARLRVQYVRPRPSEIRAFRRSKVRFGLVRGGTHTAFLLFSIPGLTVGWADASYALGMVHPEDREIDRRGPGEGWLISMLLICAETGVLHALRAVTVTPAFSERLDELVAEQRAVLPAFSRAAHEAEIAAAYRRWPTPNHMAKDALITEFGGLSFHKLPPMVWNPRYAG